MCVPSITTTQYGRPDKYLKPLIADQALVSVNGSLMFDKKTLIIALLTVYTLFLVVVLPMQSWALAAFILVPSLYIKNAASFKLLGVAFLNLLFSVLIYKVIP